jgi:pyocin large subunit-like protein
MPLGIPRSTSCRKASTASVTTACSPAPPRADNIARARRLLDVPAAQSETAARRRFCLSRSADRALQEDTVAVRDEMAL